MRKSVPTPTYRVPMRNPRKALCINGSIAYKSLWVLALTRS